MNRPRLPFLSWAAALFLLACGRAAPLLQNEETAALRARTTAEFQSLAESLGQTTGADVVFRFTFTRPRPPAPQNRGIVDGKKLCTRWRVTLLNAEGRSSELSLGRTPLNRVEEGPGIHIAYAWTFSEDEGEWVGYLPAGAGSNPNVNLRYLVEDCTGARTADELEFSSSALRLSSGVNVRSPSVGLHVTEESILPEITVRLEAVRLK